MLDMLDMRSMDDLDDINQSISGAFSFYVLDTHNMRLILDKDDTK